MAVADGLVAERGAYGSDAARGKQIWRCPYERSACELLARLRDNRHAGRLRYRSVLESPRL